MWNLITLVVAMITLNPCLKVIEKESITLNRLSVYDTALCTEQPCINGDPNGKFASGHPVNDIWYGIMAACGDDRYGHEIRIYGMVLFCGDNFGYWDGERVRSIRCDLKHGYFRLLDVYWPVAIEGYPKWNQWLIEEN